MGVVFGHAASIIVLPDATWTDRSILVDELTEALPESEVFDLGGSSDAQRMCAALLTCPALDPVTFISHGPTCTSLPAVALSMRTQHRQVRSYVLVDPVLPALSEGWPDCPVSVVYTDEALVSSNVRLRGWDWVVAGETTDAIVHILANAR